MRIRYRYVVRLLAALLFFAGAAQCGDGRDQGAEVLEETIKFEVAKNGRGKYSESRKLQIHNGAGDKYALLGIDESAFVRLTDFSARILNVQGAELRSLKPNDCVKFCGFSSYILYEDVCVRGYDLRTETYPYRVEYEYTLEFNSLFFWPEWIPQRPIPVRTSKYMVIAPAEFIFETRAVGNIPDPVVSEKGGKKYYDYELNDIRAVDDDEHIYARDENISCLSFAPRNYRLDQYDFDGSSWESLSAGCYNMWMGCLRLSDVQRQVVDSIKGESATDRDFCDKLHEVLARLNRYVGIEIGIGGWRPTPADESFKRGYGDCKDLSTMYVSMLRYAGIEAVPVLLQTKDGRLTSPDFPGLRFNHAIYFVVIDGDTLWSDPTCSFCRVGDLPGRDEDIWALSLDSGGGPLVKTPSSQSTDNCVVRKCEMAMEGLRALSISSEISSSGNSRQELTGFLNQEGSDKLGKFLTESNLGLSKKVKPDSIKVAGDENSGRIIIKGKINDAVKTVSTHKYVSLVYFSLLRSCERVKLTGRTMPIDLEYPISYVDTAVFTIPHEWHIENIPNPVNIDDKFGSMRAEFSLCDNRLSMVCYRECTAYYVSVEEIPEFAAFIDKLEKALPEYIVFIAE